MKFTSLLLLFALGFVLASCGDDDEPDCSSSDITYTSGASAILNASCAVTGCHTDTALAGMFSLEGYENARNATTFGRIKGAINHDDGFAAMPPSGVKLDQCDIDMISAWIDAGAPE